MVGRLLIVLFLLAWTSIVYAGELDLSFDEIQAFTQSRAPDPDSFAKLNRILQGSFGEPNKITESKFSHRDNYDYIRVTDWNIERGLKLGRLKAIMRDIDGYVAKYDLKDETKEQLREELELIKNTDIFTLNEVDWGIQRTKYRNVASDFAKIFNANYLFAVEFLELSPRLLEDPELDKSRYKGLHGNAIVSRFPIIRQSTLRLPLCYDWFEEEAKDLAAFEKLRRTSSDVIIKEEIISELRQGSRLALVADIELPNKDIITVISTHLENRTQPKCREKQIKHILEYVKDRLNPVILAGDLNNFETSAEPTTVTKVVKNKVKDPNFLGKLGINFINPYDLIANVSASVIGFVRKHRNPTKMNVPVILPNKAAKLFSIIKKFQFTDGTHFDLSGDSHWSYNGHGSSGRYSNSNEIATKGYVETFSFKRAFGIVKYKIDWIFVKPGLRLDCDGRFNDPNYDCKHYFPAFGRTLKGLNEHYAISDHHPITVELIL